MPTILHMAIKILAALAAVIIVFLLVVWMRPANFRVERMVLLGKQPRTIASFDSLTLAVKHI